MEYYIVGTLINLLATGILHVMALIVSSCLIYDSSLLKFLKELKKYTKYARYIMWAVSSDYCIAKAIKNKIKSANDLGSSGQEDKKNDGRRNENKDEKKLRLFIQVSNGLNLVFSLLLIAIFFVFANLKTNYIMFCFILIRGISRSVEISYAFTKDVIKNERKSTKLKSGERIILGIISYLEIILNYTLVYYVLSQFGDVPLSFGKFGDYSEISSVFFRSVGISTFTGIAVTNLDVFSVIQLFTSLALVYFAFASYIGNVGSKNDDQKLDEIMDVEEGQDKKNVIPQNKKVKKHKRKDILFTSAVIIAIIIIFTPIILQFHQISYYISLIMLPLKQQEYKSSYFEVIGALVGSFLAITGAVWTQRRINENKEMEEAKYNARIIYNDLKSIEKYLDKERGSVNIRYFSDWQNVLAKCTFLSEDNVSYIYEIYDNVYNYNYHYHNKQKEGRNFSKEDIKEYKYLHKIFFSKNNSSQTLNDRYNMILSILNN
ncbi:hypothetical protein [Clostridium beijerinckii]|uniref:hypothetical protein n=1 Tax=Clostridium beijerinckii TaxID=1520 RepID=UPI00242C0DB4|nr:hypothetical protein [Clostridium beijerinckii]MDG5852447.1 hypothetical protein [Clostridium beijerinckii]